MARRLIVSAILLALMPALASAGQLQRKCTFTKGIADARAFATNLKVTIAIEGARGAVAVSGSGTYQAQISADRNDVKFRTPVSSERIKIDAGSEAVWAITFDDGRRTGVVTAYTGTCRKAR